MAKKSSWKGKKQYALYKSENRVYKNKLSKLERHCKQYPEDEEGKKHLERVKKNGYKGRSKPKEPGSNQTTPKLKLISIPYLETPGEQLSRLLGIPQPRFKRRLKKAKTPVTIKKKKNVKKS